MTVQAWLTLAAIITGPLSVFFLTRWREGIRERRQRKSWVFRELMVTRGARLSQRHVDALNAIDVEFHAHKKVIEAWQAYFELYVVGRLHNPTEEDDKRWQERGDNLMVELLFEIAEVLDYNFDKVTIRRRVYSPMGHLEADADQWVVRRGFAQVLSGTRRLPIEVDFSEAFKTEMSKFQQPKPEQNLNPQIPEK